MKEGQITHIIFDHDGTLVDTSSVEAHLFEGIEKMLLDLHGRGLKLYIWTARDKASLKRILNSFGLLNLFEGLCCSDDAPSKPNASGPKFMLGEDISKNICMIGDSPQDMRGAQALDALGLGALWAHGQMRIQTHLKESGANICFLTVDECHKYLISKI